MLVVEVGLSINLTSLTIDQVLSKRRKVVSDMCEQLDLRARSQAQTDAWTVLWGLQCEHGSSNIPEAVERFLEEKLKPVGRHEVDHYNENKGLGVNQSRRR